MSKYNGSALVAMTGKNCVAIGCDRRFGVNLLTVSTDFNRIFRVNDRILFGMSGIATDVLTFRGLIRCQVNLLELREEQPIDWFRFKNLLSSELYRRRFGPYYVSPVVAALKENNEPYICSSDSIGAFSEPKNYVTSGTADDALTGVCESMWRPDLSPEQLFDVCAKCLRAGIERDAMSGWGAVVYVMTPEKVICKEIKTRVD